MTFKPGISGNPKGRPKKLAPWSQDVEAFVRKNRGDIDKVGDILLKHAVEYEEPWAIKMCLEYFYPKPGTYRPIDDREPTEDSLNIQETLSPEDQRTFLELWMKTKRTRPIVNSYG